MGQSDTDAEKPIVAFTPNVLSRIQLYAPQFDAAATAISSDDFQISALQIAAPMAREMNKADAGNYDIMLLGYDIKFIGDNLQNLKNYIAVYGPSTNESYGGDPEFPQPSPPPAPLTQDDYANDLAYVREADITNTQSASVFGYINRFYNPVLNDLGPAKIQLGTAMEMVSFYNDNPNFFNGTDPLGLSKYVNNTPQLAQDLLNPDTNMALSISLQAVIVLQANMWGSTHIANLEIMSDADKATFVTAFSTLGRQWWDQKYAENVDNGNYSFIPNLEVTTGADYLTWSPQGGVSNVAALLNALTPASAPYWAMTASVPDSGSAPGGWTPNAPVPWPTDYNVSSTVQQLNDTLNTVNNYIDGLPNPYAVLAQTPMVSDPIPQSQFPAIDAPAQPYQVSLDISGGGNSLKQVLQSTRFMPSISVPVDWSSVDPASLAQGIASGVGSLAQALGSGAVSIADGLTSGIGALGDGLSSGIDSLAQSLSPIEPMTIGQSLVSEIGSITAYADPAELSNQLGDNGTVSAVLTNLLNSVPALGESFSDGFGDGFSDSGFPVVFDLTGKGINITPVTSSNHFVDMTGDGLQNRTAWAGAGNGVLVLALNGVVNMDNPLSFEFTKWDPTAKTDMQALEDVFDTNHDGKLDAGDADWNDFGLMVTNADGTTTFETLSQFGITSLNLTTNNNVQVLPDGSEIQGETTYTGRCQDGVCRARRRGARGAVMSDAPQSNPGKAQFTAVLLLEKPVKLSFKQLQGEMKCIAPQAVLGGWGGPAANPAIEPTIEMLSLNSENLSVLAVDAPAPAASLQPGPFANPLWPNAEREAAGHKAHIAIIGLQDPADRQAALAKARAVTLLAAAIVRLVPAVGVAWVDSTNLVRAAAFAEMTKNIGQPEANAVPFWVRVMLAKGPPGPRGEQTMKGGTLGLRIFGLRELEYAPAPLDPGFIMQHAWSTAEYLLGSGKRLADGETISVEGQAGFAISHADAGDFVSFPIARLNLLETNK